MAEHTGVGSAELAAARVALGANARACARAKLRLRACLKVLVEQEVGAEEVRPPALQTRQRLGNDLGETRAPIQYGVAREGALQRHAPA